MHEIEQYLKRYGSIRIPDRKLFSIKMRVIFSMICLEHKFKLVEIARYLDKHHTTIINYKDLSRIDNYLTAYDLGIINNYTKSFLFKAWMCRNGQFKQSPSWKLQ